MTHRTVIRHHIGPSSHLLFNSLDHLQLSFYKPFISVEKDIRHAVLYCSVPVNASYYGLKTF